jgi:hypothetical protein
MKMRLTMNSLAVFFATLVVLDAVDCSWWTAAGFLIAAVAARGIAIRY